MTRDAQHSRLMLGCQGSHLQQMVSSDRVSCLSKRQDSKLRCSRLQNEYRLGGNSHLTGHASPVSAVTGGGAKSAGKGTKATSQCRGLLMRRSLSVSDSSPFFLRDGVTNASRRARTE